MVQFRVRYIMSRIRKSRIGSNKERLQLAVVHLARLLDVIVYFASLSLLTSDFGAMVLFSKWLDDD